MGHLQSDGATAAGWRHLAAAAAAGCRPLAGWLACTPRPPPAAVGAVGPQGHPTEAGLRQGVGQSTFMNVCINKLLAHSQE